MTHSAKIFATTILLTVAGSSNVFSQQAYTGGTAKVSYTKNTIAAHAAADAGTIITANPETVAKFSALFPKASNQQWSVSADKNWVSFLNDGRKAKASFTSNGRVTYIVTDCAMEHLPEQFSKVLKVQYANYTLLNAIEIQAHNAVAYQAIIENGKGFMTLKYTAEGIEIVKQVKKQ